MKTNGVAVTSHCRGIWMSGPDSDRDRSRAGG
jgi:hypothetical protein